jgi:ABC-type Fe3+/spermidine/putrescine transport system ATPase subunit
MVTLDPPRVDTILGRLILRDVNAFEAGQEVILLIRPVAARLAADRASEGDFHLKVVVVDCSFRGGHCRLVVQHEAGPELAFELPSGLAPTPRPGERVTLALRPEAIDLLLAED